MFTILMLIYRFNLGLRGFRVTKEFLFLFCWSSRFLHVALCPRNWPFWLVPVRVWLEHIGLATSDINSRIMAAHHGLSHIDARVLPFVSSSIMFGHRAVSKRIFGLRVITVDLGYKWVLGAVCLGTGGRGFVVHVHPGCRTAVVYANSLKIQTQVQPCSRQLVYGRAVNEVSSVEFGQKPISF